MKLRKEEDNGPTECEACDKQNIITIHYRGMWLCESCLETEKRLQAENNTPEAQRERLRQQNAQALERLKLERVESKMKETILCQTCIERGINPPGLGERKWQEGIWECHDCFTARLNNITDVPQSSVQSAKSKIDSSGPFLNLLYDYFSIPKELQFNSVDTVCRSRDKFFNFRAPAIINKTLEEIAQEEEQMAMAMFIIKYVGVEPNTDRIKVLKEKMREEKKLTGVDDSREVYAKAKPSKIKLSDEEKMAKLLGKSLDEYRAFAKAARERDFNKKIGNCPDCGQDPHPGSACKPKEVPAPVVVTPKPVVVVETKINGNEVDSSIVKEKLTSVFSKGVNSFSKLVAAKAVSDLLHISAEEGKKYVENYLATQ